MSFKQLVINTLAEQFNCILDLQKIGVVDFFMNGNNASLPVDLPVKHKSQGCNLHYSNCGGLDYWKIVKNIKPLQIFKDAKSLPLKEYDVIINDFDSITSLACKLQKVHSVRFGHQASFVSELTPRPEKKRILVGIIFKHYAPFPKYIGLHFEGYDSFILPLIIKNEIIQAVPKDLKHLTVYLPSFDKDCLEKAFSALAEHEFHWFLNDVNFKHRVGNVTYYPVNQNYFNESLIICHGIITGGGFETPAEALYLRKKVLSIPILNHYEQECNAATLKKLVVPVIYEVGKEFELIIENWLNSDTQIPTIHPNNIPETLQFLFDTYKDITVK